jgi:hypothetical protein
VRDEGVNGESAAVYTGHTGTGTETVDTTIWIAKGREPPLRLEIDARAT